MVRKRKMNITYLIIRLKILSCSDMNWTRYLTSIISKTKILVIDLVELFLLVWIIYICLFYLWNILGKIGGKQIKDLGPEDKKNCIDIYRPTGIVKVVETNLSDIIAGSKEWDEKIWNALPINKIYRRKKSAEKKDEKPKIEERPLGGIGSNLGGDSQKRIDEREGERRKKV